MSAQESKMWSNQQNKDNFLKYYSYIWAIFELKCIIECLYFKI